MLLCFGYIKILRITARLHEIKCILLGLLRECDFCYDPMTHETVSVLKVVTVKCNQAMGGREKEIVFKKSN